MCQKENKVEVKKSGLRVEGHIGTWYVIDEMYYPTRGPKGYELEVWLLEHEEYGDEAPCLLVTPNGRLLVEDVWNGFDDMEYYAGDVDIEVESKKGAQNV